MAAEMPTLAKGINEGLRAAMEHDPKVVLMGEDIGKLGGVFRVTDGLQKDFGEDRVIDTPLAESGIIGTAIGLAMRGYRPVCEIQFDGFVFPAFDQIVSQLAKMHARVARQGEDAGRHPHPVRRRHRRGRAPQRVARGLLRAHRRPARWSPAPTRSTRYFMIQQAIACDDPVIFFEPKRRYWEKAEVDIAAGSTRRRRCTRPASCAPGTDLTLVAYGPMVKTCLDAATAAAEEGGSRSRSSTCGRCRRWTCATVLASVRRTGRLVVVHEAPVFLGIGAEIAARVTEQCFYSPGGAGAAGGRVRHAVPAVAARGGVPARPRPGARRRRPIAGVLDARRHASSSSCPTSARA